MEKRDEIWYALADAKANEYYTTLVAYKYQVADWVITSALGLITLISVIAAVSNGLNSSLMVFLGIVIVFCQVTMMLNPFLLFEKYVRVYNEKRYNFQQLAHDLEILWIKVEDGKISPDAAARDFEDIHNRVMENYRFPDRTRVKTFERALKGAVTRANEYMKRLITNKPEWPGTVKTEHGSSLKFWKNKLPGNPNPPAPPARDMRQPVFH